MKKIIWSHITVAILLLSWYLLPAFWNRIDLSVFHFCHGFIEHNPFWQRFWALLSSSKVEWFHDVVFFLCFSPYFFAKGKKLRHTLNLFVGIIFAGLVIFSVSKTLFPKVLKTERHSPTAIYKDTFRLKTLVPDIKLKDSSTDSFPSDHACTGIFFIYFSFLLLSRRHAYLNSLYGLFFCMPRLVSGAHWFTDIVMGSLPVVLITTSYFIGSGAYFRIVNTLEK